jgi:hypothetical protein
MARAHSSPSAAPLVLALAEGTRAAPCKPPTSLLARSAGSHVLLNEAKCILKGRKYATLALTGCQGRVDLGVRTGRGLSSARGSAEAEAPEMAIYLGTR